MTHTKNSEEIIATLVKLADSLDQEGKGGLAAEIDQTLESFAARPKAPLKGLEDGVKKGLIAFLYKAEKNLSDSTTGLDEFCRRLRYFDVANIVTDMGLDKVIKDMNKVHMDMESAVRRFYEATHGKKPGKNDIETMMSDDKAPSQKPQEFFEAQTAKPEESAKPIDTTEPKESEPEPSEKELDDFWKDYSDIK